MHNITVMTYDHLAAQAKQLLQLVSDEQLLKVPCDADGGRGRSIGPVGSSELD
jgi:hypothetical protein